MNQKKLLALILIITFTFVRVLPVNAQTPTLTPTQQVFSASFYKNPIAEVQGNLTNSWGDKYIDITSQLTQNDICNEGDRSLGLVFTGSVSAAPTGNDDTRIWFRYTTELYTQNYPPQYIRSELGNSYSVVGINASNYSNVFRFNISGTNYSTLQLVDWLFPKNDYPGFNYKWGGTTPNAYFGTDASSPATLTKVEIGYNRLSSGSVTGTLYSMCYGSHAPGPEACMNVLTDTDMEQQPVSNSWTGYYSGGRDEFGRVNTNNILNRLYYGTSRCGDGMQLIGEAHPGLLVQKSGDFSDIQQMFYWPGGRLYARFSMKSFGGLPVNAYVKVVSWSTGATTLLFDDWVTTEWDDYFVTSVNELAEGRYNFIIGRGAQSGTGTYFAVDQVVLAPCPVSSNICYEDVPPTQTPTGTLTIQPTGTITQTPTQYPTGQTGPGVIQNCGFGYGEEYWNFNNPRIAYVNYSYDSTYGNYAWTDMLDPLIGDISQSFTWNGGIAFISVTSWNGYHPKIYLIDSQGSRFNLSMTEYSQTNPFYITARATIYLARSVYTIHLSANFNNYGNATAYDNVTVNYGGYGTCHDVQVDQTSTPANYTPTAPATYTPTSITPTMIRTSTQRATSTVMAGTPTSTPRPTYTPYPTYTQVRTAIPSFTPRATQTRTAAPTQTPRPTYTPYPSYTPQPTYTPNALGTIEPSPIVPTSTETPNPPTPQPPPDYYSECTRPDSAVDVVNWLEYQQCILLSSFAWSPRAEATLANMGELGNEKEPFGTIAEVKEANKQVELLIQQYDWQNTGLDGVNDSPDPELFLSPDADNPWFTGHIEFDEGPGTQSTQCNTALSTMFGPYITPGFCWMVNFLRDKGILPWLQLLVDIGALAGLWVYVMRKWIDAGSNAP